MASTTHNHVSPPLRLRLGLSVILGIKSSYEGLETEFFEMVQRFRQLREVQQHFGSVSAHNSWTSTLNDAMVVLGNNLDNTLYSSHIILHFLFLLAVTSSRRDNPEYITQITGIVGDLFRTCRRQEQHFQQTQAKIRDVLALAQGADSGTEAEATLNTSQKIFILHHLPEFDRQLQVVIMAWSNQLAELRNLSNLPGGPFRYPDRLTILYHHCGWYIASARKSLQTFPHIFFSTKYLLSGTPSQLLLLPQWTSVGFDIRLPFSLIRGSAKVFASGLAPIFNANIVGITCSAPGTYILRVETVVPRIVSTPDGADSARCTSLKIRFGFSHTSSPLMASRAPIVVQEATEAQIPKWLVRQDMSATDPIQPGQSELKLLFEECDSTDLGGAHDPFIVTLTLEVDEPARELVCDVALTVGYKGVNGSWRFGGTQLLQGSASKMFNLINFQSGTAFITSNPDA